MAKKEDEDPIVAEIKKLRISEGLTLSKLNQQQAILEALGVDGQDAYDKFLGILNLMQKNINTLSLRAALGLVDGDPKNLTFRRTIMALHDRPANHPRAIESIIDYENKAIAEFAELIRNSANDSPTAPFNGHVEVSILWAFNAVSLVVVRTRETDDPDEVKDRPIFRLANNDVPGPPMQIYQVPRNWNPKSVHFDAVFDTAKSEFPERVYVRLGVTLEDLLVPRTKDTVIEREVTSPAGFVSAGFTDENPIPGLYYMIWWEQPRLKQSE